MLEAIRDLSLKSLASTQRSFDKLQDGAPLDQIIQAMAKGANLHKARSYLRFYKRTYHIDLKTMRFKYHPSKKWCSRSHIPSINLYEVTDVRAGWHTDCFNEIKNDWQEEDCREDLMRRYPFLREEHSFSIIIGHDVLDLVAPSSEVRDAWVKGLEYLVQTCKTEKRKDQHDRWLKEQFIKADATKTNSLDFNECLALLKNLNINMNKEHAKKLFDQANFKHEKHDGVEVLDSEEFVKFYHMLLNRPEIEEIFKKFSINNATIMGPDELHSFLVKEQKWTDITKEDCVHLIEQFEPKEMQSELKDYMSPKGFSDLLMSEHFNIFKKEERSVTNDMTKPLNHYFIASSHNTYLIGGQLTGESSIEGYIRALQQGCRCVELDCWDGPEEEPIIYHGFTLTTYIRFFDVVTAIRDYAFKKSPYPVVLSIENHCTIDYQRKMAKYMVEVFGDLLCKEFIDGYYDKLSPVSLLQKKILVKSKKLKMVAPPTNGLNGPSSEEEEEDEDADVPGYDELEDHGDVTPPPEPEKSKETAQELSDLVIYTKSTKLKPLETGTTKYFFNDLVSLSETKATSLIKNHGNFLVNFNRKCQTRIYPKGTRTDSSNYDPMPFWNAGCNYVALNYQSKDDSMFIHEAFFSQNGRCGFVLKPSYLTDESIKYRPNKPPPSKHKRTLCLKVISAQQLPKTSNERDIVDPYVVIKVTGHILDGHACSTKIIHNNGFNPVWNEEFRIPLVAPELAVLTFSVLDQSERFLGKDQLLGKYAIPFTCLAEGYRHIRLVNEDLEPIWQSSLFVHVAIKHK